MFFRQFVDDDLGCASYLVGDPAVGEAVVVDPAFAIEQYLDAAAAEGMRIVHVFETHTHADHLSGHGRLALEHRVPVSIHPRAQPEFPNEPFADGQTFLFGTVEIRVIATPGHRPEHCAFLVNDELITTGDSLFIGDAARPDLAVEAREGALALHRSLRRLADLPPQVVVYPGHVAGSLCGTNMSSAHESTIGREKRTNYALREAEEEFVEQSASLTTPRPPTTEWLVALNRGPWVAARPRLGQLAAPGGTTVLDVRPVEAFAAGHFPGAISVALDGGSFATRAAFVLGPGESVVVHAGSEADVHEATRLLHAVGLFEQRGYVLSGGSETMQTTTVAELAGLIADTPDLQVLDVREPGEREGSAIPGAIELPYRKVRAAPPEELDPARPVYTVCAGGPRAMLAASVLAARGFDARPVLGGGAADLADEGVLLLSGSAPNVDEETVAPQELAAHEEPA